MRILIIIAIVAVLGLGGWQIFETWQGLKEKEKPRSGEETRPAATVPVEGLPPTLETSLQAAQRRGAAGLRDWLRTYGQTVRDPRLASIELDYVVLVAREDIGEARRVFARVKARTTPSSPNFSRVKQLQNIYQ